MKVLMIFIDGLGLGKEDPKVNPYHRAQTPVLDGLLGGHRLYIREEPLITADAILIPTDARLDVPGIPQSATGQTALWTGVNAARLLGYHLNGLPSPELKELLWQGNIFSWVLDRGKKAVFANAFSGDFFAGKRPRSVSTEAALAAGLKLKTVEDLEAGQAVYQDLTNEILRLRGEKVNLITPELAGRRLATIVQEHDFVLFEYFQTDVVGHRKDFARAVQILEKLDRFLGSVIKGVEKTNTLIVIVSDHGNMEDLTVGSHTLNPVPTLLVGARKEEGLEQIKSILDITPFILYMLDGQSRKI
ncbi:alkaline phosphatase family protein [Calderihabitans maritimus]|uniref:Metalloenzyme domain protein n=1 Tax=Calderihabitans maritimus TaxID=1246530 RepID=A0A1Z5HSD3_9FIRM|nr:alkaline phosphatase family protein [Calderihabitans maritimus]GAW92267.1 metalloenzyme domain protein [Calderihabitans maritimus]